MSSEVDRGAIFVVSAPSGAGKTSLANRLILDTERLVFSVSHTTRAPRPGERDGVEYFFVESEEFEAMIRDEAFLEFANVFGTTYYGTSRDFVERELSKGNDVLLDIDVQGALQVKERMPEAVLVFVFPPSFGVLKERLLGRGLDGADDIEKRLKIAGQEIRHYRQYDYMVVNDDFERSIDELESIVAASRSRIIRNRERAETICRTFYGEET